jgi:ribosome silencing factor RsfS/YbeB/iojap
MDSKKLALLCKKLAENKKAENIVVLDVRKLSSVTDYFVIASGTSEPHLRAIMNEVMDGLRDEHGIRPRRVEGGGLLRRHRSHHAKRRAGEVQPRKPLGRCAAHRSAQAKKTIN